MTRDERLYERAFGFHDQGHKPNRTGVEIGNRSIIGMNMRMNELTGAVALAQLRKIDLILETLHQKKMALKSRLAGAPGIGFRVINDVLGECATILTLLFDTKERADRFAARIGSRTVAGSGWHVYNNMEQILNKQTSTNYHCPYVCEAYGQDIDYRAHMLPQTDSILDRAVNISVGVVDKGLGAGYGINIRSTADEIDAVAERILAIVKEL